MKLLCLGPSLYSSLACLVRPHIPSPFLLYPHMYTRGREECGFGQACGVNNYIHHWHLIAMNIINYLTFLEHLASGRL